MKKQSVRLIAFILLCLAAALLSGCLSNGNTHKKAAPAEDTVIHDYAGELALDTDSGTLRQKAAVKAYIDGDTTHFYVPKSVLPTGILKARYLGIDTPESTGKIEEYGRAASRFTKEKLENASSVIIESDNGSWNLDSTGSRYLVWVWYRANEAERYRNLNVEILQEGLSLPHSAASSRYGTVCMAAFNQAKRLKLNLFSGKPDPDYYYGDAVQLTLKELRCNIEGYSGVKVAFNGIVSKCTGNGVYVEAYDAESGLYFGMPIYYGFNLSGEGLDILSVGNEVKIVGTVSFHEGSGAYQVSDIAYRVMAPDDPNNIQLISRGHEAAFTPTQPDTFINGKVVLNVDGKERTFDYAEIILAATVEMKGLSVKYVYTAETEESSHNGAMTLICEADGVTVKVRAEVSCDENGDAVAAERFRNKIIDVKGIADCFNGEPQLKVLSLRDITITENNK